MERPILTEPGTKYFLAQTLHECRKFKDRNISILFNISMMVLFVLVVGGFLIYKYKGKPTLSEIAIKNRKQQEYIISKLQQLSTLRSKEDENMITDLPLWNMHAEMSQ